MAIKTNEDYENERNRKVSSIKSVLEYAMGIFIFFIGAFLFSRNYFDLNLNKIYLPDITDKIFGIVAMLYGIWRIYRGYKKKI